MLLMKFIEFTDQCNKPVYVNPESVAMLRHLKVDMAFELPTGPKPGEGTVIQFLHGGYQVVKERIEIVSVALLSGVRPI